MRSAIFFADIFFTVRPGSIILIINNCCAFPADPEQFYSNLFPFFTQEEPHAEIQVHSAGVPGSIAPGAGISEFGE